MFLLRNLSRFTIHVSRIAEGLFDYPQGAPLSSMIAILPLPTDPSMLFNSLRASLRVFTSSVSLRLTLQIQSTGRHLSAMSGQRAWSCR